MCEGGKGARGGAPAADAQKEAERAKNEAAEAREREAVAVAQAAELMSPTNHRGSTMGEETITMVSTVPVVDLLRLLLSFAAHTNQASRAH